MSIYGDRGNSICLTKRCTWRGIGATIVRHSIGDHASDILKSDLILMGGAQDRQQELVSHDLMGAKSKLLKKCIVSGVPGLYICGAYQFLGRYYKMADGTTIPGLGIFDVYTKHPGLSSKRLIGNIHVQWDGVDIVGFENHGGRTYLGAGVKPLASVVSGYGNNGIDGSEGMICNHSIGTYLHGPLLPKNPELADWLIQKALERKYGRRFELEPLDDTIELHARHVMIGRI